LTDSNNPPRQQKKRGRKPKPASAPRPSTVDGAQIISCRHLDRRKNNPEVGVVTPATDLDLPKTSWSCDPHLDPALQFSLFPRQVFFPMAGKGEGWQKLKKNIRAELNEELLDQIHGTVSLPFKAGDNRKVAVKIVDDRGIESLKIIPLED
jgi:hypothetical protein